MKRPYKLQYLNPREPGSFWKTATWSSFEKLESAIQLAKDKRGSWAERGEDWHFRVIDTRVKNEAWSGDYKVLFSTKDAHS